MERVAGKDKKKSAIREFKRRFYTISGYISFMLALFFAGYLLFMKHEFWPHAFLMVLPASLPVVRQSIFETGNTKHFFAYLLLMLVFIGMVIATVPVMGVASLLTFGSVLCGSWFLTAGLLVAEKSSLINHEQKTAEHQSLSIYHIEEEEEWDVEEYDFDRSTDSRHSI